jgi:N-acetylneuraminic acid mutarotase
MLLNSLFTAVIYFLISILIICIVKVYMNTFSLNKKSELEYLKLVNHFTLEKEKHKINNQKILLIEGLNKSLFNRLFKIINELILLQKSYI